MKMRLYAVVFLISICANAYGQECLFDIGDPATYLEANRQFHDLLGPLQHGPVQERNVAPVKEQINKLVSRRDTLMQSRLATRHRKECPALSSRAIIFSKSVDQLAAAVEAGADDETILRAFEEMHDAYRSMQQSLMSADFLVEQFHTVLHPLWHESYPDNDAEAIKAQIPRLLVRAQLIVNFAKERNMPDLQESASKLVDSARLLEQAAAAEDDFAVLVGLEQMHEAFHDIREHQ